MEALDPFFNPEEEARAKAQATANSSMRNALRKRTSTDALASDAVDNTGDEFIKMGVSEPAAPTPTQESLMGKIPWMPTKGYPPYSNFYLRLHQEVLDFTRWISLTTAEQASRDSFLARLNGVCKSLWRKSKVVPFGSFYTGLSLPSSDIDVSVVNVKGTDEVGTLRRLANALLEQQQVSFIELRETAKVPILRIRDINPPHCELDINVNIESPQATSKFIIRNGVDQFPAFRPLMLILKSFLAHRNLADTFTGGIGSYLLSCLVIAFLQQHPVSGQARMAELTSLGHLLFDFFNFFAREFRVDRDGLSVRRGGSKFAKSSREFDNGGRPAFGRRSLSSVDALCVESPLQPELDIGNKVFQWKVIRSTFMQTRQVMIDEIQKYNPENSMRSFLAPALLDPCHPTFQRFTESMGEDKVPCPLANVPDMQFVVQSLAAPPSPYSEEEIDLDDDQESRRWSEGGGREAHYASDTRSYGRSHGGSRDSSVRSQSYGSRANPYYTQNDERRNDFYTKRNRRS